MAPSCVHPKSGARWGHVWGRGGGGRTLASRVLVVLDEAGQPEVGDFAAQGVRHEDVGGSQVAVDVVLGLDEGHAFGDLRFGGIAINSRPSSSPGRALPTSSPTAPSPLTCAAMSSSLLMLSLTPSEVLRKSTRLPAMKAAGLSGRQARCLPPDPGICWGWASWWWGHQGTVPHCNVGLGSSQPLERQAGVDGQETTLPAKFFSPCQG